MTGTAGESSTPPSFATVLTIALLCGLVPGVLEPVGLVSGVSQSSEGHRALGAYLLWMPAAANLILFTVLGTIGWALARLFPRQVTVKGLLVTLATVAFMASLRILDGYLGKLTIDLIALGIAVQASQRWSDRLLQSLRPVRILLVMAMLALVTIAMGIEYGRGRAERRIFAALPAARPGSPNILLLVLDTVRAMNLSAYGYSRRTTPTFEALAARGTLFERVISAAPWTRPAHASLFTGRWDYQHTADHNSALDGTYPTLAEELGKLGYRTGGFTANLTHTTRSSGIARGFAHYEDHPLSLPQVLVSAATIRPIYRALQKRIPIPQTRVSYRRKSAAEVNQQMLAWLDHSGDTPFFAFANYMDAHADYAPQPPFDTAFAEPAYPAPLPTRGKGPGMDKVQRMRPYDQAIAYIDHEIGRLLAGLKERGLLENTIVIVTADHGEGFGEHGIYGHGATLYTPMLQVPLIVVWPGQIPAGRRVPQWVSTRNLASTLMHLAAPGSAEPFPGLPLSRFWESDTATSETLFAGSGFAANNPNWYPTTKGHLAGILDHGMMLIREADDHRELYEPGTDPWMKQDLFPLPQTDTVRTRLGEMLEREVGPAVLHRGYRPPVNQAAVR